MGSEMLSETHRWPDGAVVVPSDLPEFGAAVADAVESRAPFVLVFPDGQEVVFRYRGCAALRSGRLCGRQLGGGRRWLVEQPQVGVVTKEP